MEVADAGSDHYLVVVELRMKRVAVEKPRSTGIERPRWREKCKGFVTMVAIKTDAVLEKEGAQIQERNSLERTIRKRRNRLARMAHLGLGATR